MTMLKIKILDLGLHRNETTFRPYINRAYELGHAGIEFVDHDDYDIAWVGQASIIDKSLSLEDSIKRGVDFCSKIRGNYMIFDGQDSHSLIGTFEVFSRMRELHGSRCMGLFKNSLLKNFNMYMIPKPNGRWYMGGDGNYSIPNINNYSDSIFLSGTNWLNTVEIPFSQYTKIYDVCALFSYPLTRGHEHGREHHLDYNAHRKPCVEALQRVNSSSVMMLTSGMKLPIDEYHRILVQSKVTVAPFGFGEMAPRDIQTMATGGILIKPEMDYLKSDPWMYVDGVTYIACKNDYSDLEEKIDFALHNYDSIKDEFFNNAREKYDKLFNDEYRIPLYLHSILNNMPQIEAY